MKGNKHVKTITNITYPAFALFAFAWFALSPQARADCIDDCLINFNTAQGDGALQNNQGSYNTAFGDHALFSNFTGIFNTATGEGALINNVFGNGNTANGRAALASNTNGSGNTASGSGALQLNTIGIANTATGVSALFNNTTGTDNTAIGGSALLSNTTGSSNTGIGLSALINNTTGSFNIALGNAAGENLTTGSNNIDIDNVGVAGESNTVRVGTSGTQTTTFIAGIHGVAIAGGQAVTVNASGQLGVRASSARFKEAITLMGKASEAILSLHPVSFHYNRALDPNGTPEFGLIAEEVAKVDRDLVINDEGGKPFTVRYDAVNAVLLNEFLKEHRTVQELKSIVAKQEATAAHQQKQIEALTAGLQKVSAQLELSKTAPQTVLNNQ